MTTKTNQPLQLFTMFPPGGASTLKGFTAAPFGPTPTTGSSADRHHHRATQHGEEEASAVMVDSPPVRPVRHVQHASQWAESKTTVAPGLFVRSTTVSTSQWSEYSTSTVTEGVVFHGQSSSSTTQFQTTPSTTGATSNPTLMSSAQYLDDLQLPTQQLDLAAQLGKGSIARKGSLGGRRPPTVRYRRVNSQGSLPYDEREQLPHQEKPVPAPPVALLSVPTTMNGTDATRAGKSRTPPPRPPPPKFHQKQVEQAIPAVSNLAPPATHDWNSSRSGTPPSLPANSPPPLPEREDLDFVMDELSSSASESSSSAPHPAMTDVVEINDKESVGEDGEVVRRRTIITLGPRTGAAPAAAAGSSSSSSINITLLNGGPAFAGPVTSSQSSDVLATKAVTEQAAMSNTSLDETHRANTRASAFNARRTIEQRRQQRVEQQKQEEEEEEEEEPDVRELEPPEPVVTKTLPASTYLYGERGSPASSFGGSSLRTMSISMSFDDLDESNSNASITEQQRRSGGRNRTEAWYERRQSYGFEAADKLQSLLNTSGSSDVPSTGAVSRSCDSLSSTVRSTSSAIEKMIPPWIKNPSPKQAEEETGKSPSGSSRLSYFERSMDDVSADDESEENRIKSKDPPSSSAAADHKPAGQARRTPTPTSIQRSESSRSATNVLEEAEPIWLRDLRVRRSLRDGRRKPPAIKSPPPMETPIWLGVKLRPTGLSLVDPDPSAGPASSASNLPSPTKPHHYTPIFTFTNTGTTSKIQQHLRNSRENLLSSTAQEPTASKAEERPVKVPTSSESKGELANQQTVIESSHSNNTTTFRLVPAKSVQKPTSSSIVIVNSSRESLHSVGTVDSFTCETASSSKLNHHRSIELMRMLEETPLVSTNGVALRHDRMDSASAVNTETGSVYSMGDWTECSSAVASVKNSNEDLTTMEVRKAKKVAFGADVKEESDQKRSRPRRIRSRSPESRLRQWQEKLEEVKSTVIHQTASVHQPTLEFGTNVQSASHGLPLRRFGDDIKNLPESNAHINSSNAVPSTTTSDTFRSLLQPRKPYAIVPPTGHPAVPVKESVIVDSYPPMMKAYSTTSSVEVPICRPAPVVIRNGIVNFDSSVERKIVILEEKETIPAPKSILKKRSVENLLDIEPVVKPAVIAVTQTTVPVIPAHVTASQSVHSGITVSMTNQKREPPPEHQEILPWRIHLKHVEQPPTIHSIPVQQQQQQQQQQQSEPEAVVPPWRLEMNRKKTPPFAARAPTPDNFFSRGRSPCSTTSESSTATIPGMSAAELIRNLRPNPVMMVARCEVKESVFRPPVSTQLEAEVTSPLESDPSSVRADHGYHSLEPEAESSAMKRHPSSSVRQQQTTVDETRTIDETIAQLNETIEEIRSLDVVRPESEAERTVTTPVAKTDIGNPSASSSPYPVKIDKPSAFYPALSHSKSGSKMPENRFVVREIRPSGSVNEARTFFQSTASSEMTHQRSTVTSNRRDSIEADSGRAAEAAEMKPANHQLQRLRETTKLLAEGHPQLRAAAKLSQTNETRDVGCHHASQNGDVPTSATAANQTSPGQKRRQSFAMTSPVEHDAVQPTLHVVHHKPSESNELREPSVEEVMSQFDSTLDEALSDHDELRDSIIRKMTSTTFSSRSSTRFAANKTREETTSSFASALNPPPSGRSKSQPAKRSNSIELTSGMPEEKAALLVRKFFGNSVIETKKSRMAKTETIMEESSEVGCSSSSFSEEKTLLEVAVEAFSSPSPQPAEAYGCDDFFHRPSSEAEGMSTSSFGSVLDVMDTTTDDERSIRTTSSTTMTNTTRYSSCSERSVKLSDIINRPDRPSLLDSAVSSSSCATPVTDEFSCATSESASIAISVCQTTTDSSSVGSDFSRSGSGGIRRNKTQRHPTVIRKDKSSVPAVSVKSSARTPPSRSRGGAGSSKGANHRSSASASPSTSSTSGLRRRSNGSGSSKSTGDPAKGSANRSGGSKSATPVAPPVRPPRALQQVNPSADVKKRCARTPTGGSTLRNATAASSAKLPTSSARKSPGSQADRKTSTSAPSGGTPLANRTNRLVTITSYKTRTTSTSVKPDDASAVSGIKVTPVAVGSGHYKIRMDQRIAAAAAEKASKTTAKKSSTSQRTNGIKTTTTTLEKRSNATSGSRNTTVKADK
ncbi:LOW QUALITY PROTEIN: uncharacterized protein LOC130692927 [Daphnia carinata]|uniref:LOW QUALITY PROTEIN: uncharacterized protein LOC130692927 n=1 Tax=Daphnia carinata TaxID=120202 RepID=UPI002868A85A|nr:LOW QUALITY PROTEIN: uncharacterized protein LOC130692927 [Daphnia carinata]